MKLSVGLKLSNSLSLTPQLQQAIRLLQLSNLELQEEISLQLESNPLLEKIEEHTEQLVVTKNEQLEPLKNIEEIPNDLTVDAKWDDIYVSHSSGQTDENYEIERSYRKTLKSILLEQINLLKFSKVDQLISHLIIDELDEKGFLPVNISEITASANLFLEDLNIEVENSEVLVVIKHIQNLEPFGVASKGLVEYLQLQIVRIKHISSKEYALKILEQYHYLLSNDISKLIKKAQMTMDEFNQGLELIRTLKPYPSLGLNVEYDDYQIPDVVVKKNNNKWQIELNSDVVPKLRVDPYYSGLIKRADSSADNQYLKSHMIEAKNFIKSIDERHKTLLKVTACIVKYQQEFLEKGAEFMKPLILRDIAEEVDLHESTISRVTTNKYLLTPKGLFELKYFFSSHVGTSVGGECSSTAIRAKIKKMIAAENPKKPLSDNVISNQLKQDGIEVARRTVAKYRESLHIPSSSERKILI
ncbi:RNA polymerase factor sigma-54 [Acinetobacter sp. HY1485]|uniref:RNA polymerase factor sigma-54 n=1 Tax=Acinetobacter sp. HY1485 TaxID=2970918 RepID=UPI0022B99BAB|nr:RNA polymerase factor sigma-54 [Acinetobacter sp. HY1485]